MINIYNFKDSFSIGLLFFLVSRNIIASEYEYNVELLKGVNPSSFSLYMESDFEYIEGPYEIYINSDYITSGNIYFEGGVPCVNDSMLEDLNIKKNLIDEIKSSLFVKDKNCHIINKNIIETSIDSNSFIFTFHIPQASIIRGSKGYVDPSEYVFGDDGLYVNYAANKYIQKGYNGKSSRDYLSIDSGLNINSWYLRHLGYLNDSYYINNQTYLTRVVPEIKSAVKIGRYSTSGRLFNSIPMEGFALENKTEMLPPTQQGFAPTIRGTASTTAIVKVEQNELEIYRQTVPPGDFIIDDLYPLGFGSDLIVTIEESDGTEKRFRVVYNPTSRMLRPGVFNQNIYFGKTNLNTQDISFMEYGAEFGVNNTTTIYGGLQTASDYNSQLIGVSLGTVLGGISMDIINSNSYFNKWLNGQSYNLNWSKHIDIFNSDISFSAFRYSTEDYYTLSDYVNDQTKISNNSVRTKGSIAVSLNQSLGNNNGSLYANISHRRFWNSNEIERQYQIGYSNFWDSLNYSISLNRTKRENNSYDTSFQLSLNFPLSFDYRYNTTPTVSFSLQQNDSHHSERLGINGVYGENSNLSYGLSSQRSSSDKNIALNSYISYKNRYSDMNINYAHNNNQNTYSFGLKGAVVAWEGGVAFSSQQSDTFAIAQIEDVSNAIINDNYNQITDNFGNAVVTGIYPYRRNRVIVNDKFVDDNIFIANGSKSLVPVRGSISLLNFEYEYKYNILLYIESKDIIDFGTPLRDEQGEIVGYVGQGNRALVSLNSNKGKVSIDFNDNCSFQYNILPETKRMKVKCKI